MSLVRDHSKASPPSPAPPPTNHTYVWPLMDLSGLSEAGLILATWFVTVLLVFERHQPVKTPESRNKADTCLALSLLCLYLTVSRLQDGGPQGQSSTTCQALSRINNEIRRLFDKLEGTLSDFKPHFEIKLGWQCAECKLKQNANLFHINCISCHVFLSHAGLWTWMLRSYPTTPAN